MPRSIDDTKPFPATMIQGIFRNSETEKQFQRDGFVVLDFITEEEATLIAKKFYEIHPTLPQGFYADAYNPDDELKAEIFQYSDGILNKNLDVVFHDYKKLGCTFLCKTPGEKGKVGVHQDWSVVDESKFYSITIWIPTADTIEENGALRVLPGSHLFFNNHRSNNIPVAYRDSEELLWKNMITVPMKAGQAFILNHATIHGSSANSTNKERLVIAYGLVHDNAKLTFHHQEKNIKDAKVEKFEMPDDFFLRYYNVGERPLFGKMVDTFSYTVEKVNSTAIQKLIDKEMAKRISIPFYRDNWIDKNKKLVKNEGFFKRVTSFFTK